MSSYSLRHPLGRNSVASNFFADVTASGRGTSFFSDPTGSGVRADQKKKEQEIERTNALVAQQQAARAGAQDTTLDEQTRKEFNDLYTKSLDNLDTLDGQNLANVLDQARKGEGIYGIRRANSLTTQLNRSQPGRSAVMNLGAGRVLGGKV